MYCINVLWNVYHVYVLWVLFMYLSYYCLRVSMILNSFHMHYQFNFKVVISYTWIYWMSWWVFIHIHFAWILLFIWYRYFDQQNSVQWFGGQLKVLLLATIPIWHVSVRICGIHRRSSLWIIRMNKTIDCPAVHFKEIYFSHSLQMNVVSNAGWIEMISNLKW